MFLIKINNLKVENIISSVNMQLETGQVHCLIGKNGSGKTTLLRALTGQQKYSGEITVNGADFQKLSMFTRASIIGYIPQRSFMPKGYSVRDFFLMLEAFRGVSIIDNDYICSLGVTSLFCKNLSVLSGGELQKVIIASVLCSGCKYLLMDEPTNNLDPFAFNQLIDIVSDISQTGIGVVIATHDLNLMQKIGTDFTAIKNGISISCEKTQILKKTEAFVNIYS